jgi:hypothetical protein
MVFLAYLTCRYERTRWVKGRMDVSAVLRRAVKLLGKDGWAEVSTFTLMLDRG